MEKTGFNLQTIVLVSAVLSAAVLFGAVFSLQHGYYTQMADAQRSSGDTKPGIATSTTQQLPTINDAIQLSAKEESSGYKWIDTTNGVINPTLNLNAGTNKAIQLQNPTDAKHQLIIVDPNGNQLVTSGDIASGSSRLLSFTPGVSGTFQYHCLYHPTTMKGTIQVQ
jgi:hypothetical protein